MALIICGHERSGTILLRNLCDSHPNMAMTMEFNNFADLGEDFSVYHRHILKKWWNHKHRSFLVQGKKEEFFLNVIKSYLFVGSYLHKINKHQQGVIDIPTIEIALKEIFPNAKVVGDKMPNYLFQLDKLVKDDHLVRVVIYRDCRALVSSVLEKIRNDWKKYAFIKQFDTAEKVAKRWVYSIEMMEKKRMPGITYTPQMFYFCLL